MSILRGLRKAFSIWLLVMALKTTPLGLLRIDLESLNEMPGNRLALTVEVGGEPQACRILEARFSALTVDSLPWMMHRWV